MQENEVTKQEKRSEIAFCNAIKNLVILRTYLGPYYQ